MSGSLLPSVDLLLQTNFCPEGDTLHDQLVVSIHLGHCQWCGFPNCKQNWQTCALSLISGHAHPCVHPSPHLLLPVCTMVWGHVPGAWAPVGTRHAAHPATTWQMTWFGWGAPSTTIW